MCPSVSHILLSRNHSDRFWWELLACVPIDVLLLPASIIGGGFMFVMLMILMRISRVFCNHVTTIYDRNKGDYGVLGLISASQLQPVLRLTKVLRINGLLFYQDKVIVMMMMMMLLLMVKCLLLLLLRHCQPMPTSYSSRNTQCDMLTSFR